LLKSSGKQINQKRSRPGEGIALCQSSPPLHFAMDNVADDVVASAMFQASSSASASSSAASLLAAESAEDFEADCSVDMFADRRWPVLHSPNSFFKIPPFSGIWSPLSAPHSGMSWDSKKKMQKYYFFAIFSAISLVCNVLIACVLLRPRNSNFFFLGLLALSDAFLSACYGPVIAMDIIKNRMQLLWLTRLWSAKTSASLFINPIQ
jgi:hypothetical protein